MKTACTRLWLRPVAVHRTRSVTIPGVLDLTGIDRTLGGSVRSLPPERPVNRIRAAYELFSLVQHSRTKHIDIRHHFLRDHVAKNDISLEGVRTEDQLVDIFTKPLDEATFCRLRNELVLSLA